VVVTSRDDLTGLVAREGVRRIDLDVLTSAEAVGLLGTLVGARVDADPEAAAALAQRCARLPLALRIAAELATARPTASLGEVLDSLHDEQHRLDLLDAAGDPRTAVRSVFSWSYRHLTAAGAEAFGLLGLHPGGDFDPYAAAALADTTLERAQALVDELARTHLVEPSGAGRHTMHDLLRAYAKEQATEAKSMDECRSAQTRLFDHYLASAAVAMDTLFPYEHRRRPEVGPPKTPSPPLGDAAYATSWLDQERANLVAVAMYTARHGWPRHCVDLSRTLWRHLEVGGHYQEALAVHTSAAHAAPQAAYGRPAVLANLGNVHWWLGNYRRAQAFFEQSLAGHRQVDDPEGQAWALARLGLVHERLGGYPEALANLARALAIYRRTGNRQGEGAQLLNLGALYRRLGRYTEAADHQQLAAAAFVEVGDRRLEGYALGNLGNVYSLLGRHDDALANLERALAKCRECGDRGGEASALGTIGATYARQERFAEAVDHLQHALAISRETGERSLETETLNTLGETLRAMGQPGPARSRHLAALDLAQQTGDRFEQARSLDGIARALAATGARAQAREHWRRALPIYSALGVPEAAQVRAALSAPASTMSDRAHRSR
jgi:tetratricopeptide (TPR) repeat protein